MEGWIQDLRFALRRFARRPAMTATAVLTLGLGIGANTAIFGLIEAALIRPLPYPDADRLVMLWQTMPGEDRRWVAPANFLDWRAARSFDGMAAFLARERIVSGVEQPLRLRTASVSASFFELLGVAPVLGRGFGAEPAEATPVLIGHGLWRTLYAGDPEVVGRSLTIDGSGHRVAGVLPPGFAFPEGVALWTLAPRDVPDPGLPAPDHTAVRDSRFLSVLARLAPGVGLDAARAELAILAARLEREHPEANADTGINAVPLREQLVGDTRATLGLLFGAVALVLLIACANVANLLLADATRRRGERAIRTALGAGRARLVRQSLGEAGLLALLGGATGLLLASWGAPLLAAALPEGAPDAADTGRPALVLFFTLLASGAAAILFGTAPALRGARPDLAAALSGMRGVAGGAGRGRLRNALVVAEVALAALLVVGAGLLVRTLWNLQHARPGYQSERVLTARVSLPAHDGRPDHESRRLYGRIVERLAALPGVESAAAGVALPLTGRSPSANVRVEGRSFSPGTAPDVSWRAVTGSYFETLGIPVRLGRGFVDGDAAGAPAVALVNETLAHRLWPGESPLGRRLGTGLDGEQALATVVGVVGDTPQESLAQDVQPELFRPLAQESRGVPPGLYVALRTAPGLALDGDVLRAAVRDVAPEAPVDDVAALRALEHRAGARPRQTGLLLGLFAGLALTLACVGLYGVMACAVGERRAEIGVRLALGARPGAVLRQVLASGLSLAAAGSALGLAAATLLSRVLSHLLFGVQPVDLPTYGAVAAALLTAAAAASLLPARRAARVDPARALRQD